MVKWKKGFYVGEKAQKSLEKIVLSINENRLQRGVFVIVPAANGTDIFDILPAYALMCNPDLEGVTVLGVAKGKDEAMELASKMIMDVYVATGTFNVREFFS